MEKYKIAIVFMGDPYHPKGIFNAVVNRAKYLQKLPKFEVDIFCICSYDPPIIKKIRNSSQSNNIRQKNIRIEGIQINLWWHCFSLIDYILTVKLHKQDIFYSQFLAQKGKSLKEYDLISAHSFDGALVAYESYREYGIPFTITWHGSDIHTLPWINKSVMERTIKVSSLANANLYVSQALLSLSNKIIRTNNKYLSYNGVDDCFIPFLSERVSQIKQTLGISAKTKIVSFIGGLVEIKNVLLLPEIFDKIQNKYGNDIIFWVIGNGKLKNQIKKDLESRSNLNYKFFGDIPTEEIPSLLNCTDVLVLPSKNEGLPLVIVEAYGCGTQVVTSDVGGCKEVVGEKNVIKLDDKFIGNLSNRVVELLNSNTSRPKLETKFHWSKTIELEAKVFLDAIKSRIEKQS